MKKTYSMNYELKSFFSGFIFLLFHPRWTSIYFYIEDMKTAANSNIGYAIIVDADGVDMNSTFKTLQVFDTSIYHMGIPARSRR